MLDAGLMHDYFYPESRAGEPDVVKVLVPGCKRPVYAHKDIADKLKQLVAAGKGNAAFTLVQWFGGMQYQR